MLIVIEFLLACALEIGGVFYFFLQFQRNHGVTVSDGIIALLFCGAGIYAYHSTLHPHCQTRRLAYILFLFGSFIIGLAILTFSLSFPHALLFPIPLAGCIALGVAFYLGRTDDLHPHAPHHH